MIFVSSFLDFYFKQRLKNSNYRKVVFKQSLERKLSSSKLGRVLIRNIHEAMVENPSLHEEFSALIGTGNYQKIFWESDLGFYWLNGNYNVTNPTFKLALEIMKSGNYTSHLDVGCGWGELSYLISTQTNAQQVLGIDISEKLIMKAKSMHLNKNLEYQCKDVMDIEKQFDFVTVIGPSDYINPSEFPVVLKKIISITGKEVLLLNSLRSQPIEKVLSIKSAIEVRRYDVGYIQPLNYLLKQLQFELPFMYTIEKHGLDALLARIIVSDNKKN